MTGEDLNNFNQDGKDLDSTKLNGDLQWWPDTWNDEKDKLLNNQDWNNNEMDQDNDNEIDKYSAFLNNMGQDHVNKMMDDYEKVSEMIDDKDVLSKLSKDDIIKLYQTEAQLKWELDNILPMLESQKNNEVEDLLGWLEDSPLKNYILDMAEDAESPDEVSALVDMAKKMYELAGGKAPESNDWDWNIKADMAGNDNSAAITNIDPVQGMFSKDPKVRDAASKSMDKLLTDMLTKQYS